MISSKKINLIAILLIALVLVGTVCAMFAKQSGYVEKSANTYVYSDLHSVAVTDNDFYKGYGESAERIILTGTSAESTSNNVEINGGEITIRGGGEYVLSGSLEYGTVTVDNADGAAVILVFNGVSITSSDFSALYVKQSEKTVISLVPGTENFLNDAVVYNEEKQQEGKPSAALYSKDNLVINGTGSLTVSGNYKDGIKANDSLLITEGIMSINAAENGIAVNDYILALNSSVAVKSGNDCIKCNNDEEKWGFIAFEGTNLSLAGGGDGISASSAVYMNNAIADITAGGGSENAAEKHSGFRFFEINNGKKSDDKSTKGVKAGTYMCINGGSYVIDSCDDAIHSDGDLKIAGGVFAIMSGDDGVHSDMNLIVAPDKLDIKRSYEGLEGAYVTINSGDINIVSEDDGINATGESGSGMGMPGMHSTEEKTEAKDIWLTVNGGCIRIEADGDGFDSNGSAVLNGGVLEIYGPEDNGNGSIDVGDGGYVFLINGGTLLAAGSSGMAETPSEQSTQCSTAFYLDDEYMAGSEIALKDTDGNIIASGMSNKKFKWICVSSENIKQGATYTLFVNDTAVMSVTVDKNVSVAGSRGGSGQSGERSRIQK